MDDGGFLRGLVEALTVDVDEEGQKPRPQEAGHARGDEVDGRECCDGGTSSCYLNQSVYSSVKKKIKP